MTKPLFLFVGKSSSGKTTIADMLERKYGLTQMQSYTTRPPRHENEIGHIFISESEFDKLENLVAYTNYNGFRYGATAEQADNVSIYVIDVDGVVTLMDTYKTERPIVVFYFDSSICTRIDRMIERNDPDVAIVSRLYNDEMYDWENKLSKLVWHYKNNLNRNISMYTIDANESVDSVLSNIINFIELEIYL